jgi:hypothetical protein
VLDHNLELKQRSCLPVFAAGSPTIVQCKKSSWLDHDPPDSRGEIAKLLSSRPSVETIAFTILFAILITTSDGAPDVN